MSELHTGPADEAAGESGFEVLTPVGAQLRTAREAKKMAVADIALTLKLGNRQVEALENGDWGSLPGNTFIRGFVRNYARIVGLEIEPLMAELDRVLQAPKQQLAVHESSLADMPQTGSRQKRDLAFPLLGLGLVAVAVAIFVFLPNDISALRSAAQGLIDNFSRKEVPVEAAKPAEAKADPVFPPGVTPQQVMTPQAANAPAEAPGSASLPAPQQLQPEAPLRLVFEKESWVEVRDKEGKVVFSQRNAGGTEQDVAGQGPFALVVGFAPGVKVLFRGKPVDLAPHTRGDVARLNLE